MKLTVLALMACVALLAVTIPAEARTTATCPLTTTQASRLIGGHLVRVARASLPKDVWCAFGDSRPSAPTRLLQIGRFPTTLIPSLQAARGAYAGKHLALPSAGPGAFVTVRRFGGGTIGDGFAPHVAILVALGGRPRAAAVATLSGRVFHAIYRAKPGLRP